MKMLQMYRPIANPNTLLLYVNLIDTAAALSHIIPFLPICVTEAERTRGEVRLTFCKRVGCQKQKSC